VSERFYLLEWDKKEKTSDVPSGFMEIDDDDIPFA
jgi:hypothetical protein